MTQARLAVAAALVVSIASVPARATVMVGADLPAVARAARFVARGRVIDAVGRWTADHRTMETLVTLEVDAWLKGALGDTVTFTAPGGRLGRYRSFVVGAPDFEPGDRIVVFLGARGPGVPFLIGLAQGVYRVGLAADRSGDVVTPPALLAGGTPARVVRGDPARRPMAVDAFDALVRRLAEAQP